MARAMMSERIRRRRIIETHYNYCTTSTALLLTGLLTGALSLAGCKQPDTRMSVYEFMDMQNQVVPEPQPVIYAATQPASAPADGYEAWSAGDAYEVGTGDELEVTIGGLEAVGMPGTYRVRIDSRGQVQLPTVGEIKIAGMTLDEVENTLESAYSPKYIKDARVHVSIAESATGEQRYQPVHSIVMGEVLKPATVEMRRDHSSILQAILSAGGPTEFANGLVLVIPSRDPNSAFTLDLNKREDIVRAARPGSVRTSDVVIVQRRSNDFVYLTGLVTTPGPIPITPNGRMTVLQAIAAGGGTLIEFQPREATLRRTQPNGEVIRVKLDLRRILNGEDPDISLAPGDVVSVPHTDETRFEEFIARTFVFRFGADTVFNPWTHYYFKKDREIRERQLDASGGFFNTFGMNLLSQDLTPLTQSGPGVP